jgi:hypothetical protein
MGGLKPKNCIVCGKDFVSGPTAKYCSRKCQKVFWLEWFGVKIVCKWCGKDFKVEPERASKALFCSFECYWAHKGRDKVEITCEVCGKKRLVSRGLSHIRRCSRKCMGIANKGHKVSGESRKKISESVKTHYGYTDADRIAPCAICGKPVFRQNPSHLKRKVTCGKECYAKLLSTDDRIKIGRAKGGRMTSGVPKGEAHKEALREAHAYRKRRVMVKCDQCGKEWEVRASRAADRERRGYKLIFCNQACSTAWKLVNTPRGEDSPSYGVPPPKGAGRCRWYEYESPVAGRVLLQGMLELRFAKLLDAEAIRWERCRDRFSYVGIDGRGHKYGPDFKILDRTEPMYVETKGYLDEACAHKLMAVKGSMNLVVLRESDIGSMEAGRPVEGFLGVKG